MHNQTNTGTAPTTFSEFIFYFLRYGTVIISILMMGLLNPEQDTKKSVPIRDYPI
jgi:hypothetical protein